MNLRFALAAFAPLALAAFAVGCAAPAAEEAGEAQGASSGAKEEHIMKGRYTTAAEYQLIITGRGSQANLLRNRQGDHLAEGDLGDDGRTIRAPEGDVCGAYALSQVPGRLTVDVLWQSDPTASAHRDPAIASGCKAIEGTYELE